MPASCLKRTESVASKATDTTAWSTPWTRSPNSRSIRSSSCERRQEPLLDVDKRQFALELLELRGTNKMLERQLRRTKRYVADLTNEHHALSRSNVQLMKERDEARATIEKLRLEGKHQSEALTKTTVLLGSEREIRMHSEQELERCQAVLREQEAIRRARYGRSNQDNDNAGSTLTELLKKVRRTLTGTVGKWVRGMQVECCADIRETEIIPWMLQKSFFLCAELVEGRREELVAFFKGGGRNRKVAQQYEGEALDPATAEFMHYHLRRHHLTLFPLSGRELRNAVGQITSSLAQSMMASKEWDPNQRDPDVVVQALAASGLGKVVKAYLGIMVGCCLQHPPVTFTDDLGKVQRYNEDIHSEPIDGEAAGDWCVVVFPALVTEHQWGVTEVLAPRFVLNGHKAEREGNAKGRTSD